MRLSVFQVNKISERNLPICSTSLSRNMFIASWQIYSLIVLYFELNNNELKALITSRQPGL